MKAHQRGVALLIIALILSFTAVGIFLSPFSFRSPEFERPAETTRALAEAKAALLGFAWSFEATEQGEYGFLPCPETKKNPLPAVGEGSATGSECGTQYANRIGRLPWRSLRSAPLRDGDKECLWYAVSSAYKRSQTSTNENTMLNADSPGQLKLVAGDGTVLRGATPDTRAVAIIFSAGSILPGQDRSQAAGLEQCPGNYMPTNYLDSYNDVNNGLVQTANDRIDTFIVSNKGQNFNDRLVFVTQEEIFGKLTARTDYLDNMKMLSYKIATCVANFAQKSDLPWASPLALADYRVNVNYQSDSNLNPKLTRGRVPYQQVNSSPSSPAITNIIPPDTKNPPLCGKLTASDLALWKNWKDHFFYARATDLTCSVPASCLTVNGSNNYIAIIFFAGGKLGAQSRGAPPLDPDDKMTISNYLEGRNASNFTRGGNNFESHPPSPPPIVFNDLLYCISAGSFEVSPC